MGEKKKNGETRTIIISHAKKHFYQFGYNKTRMQAIADDSGIALGTLSYHFAKKENIVSSILTEYLQRLYDHVASLCNEPLNALERHFYASIPFYHNLLTEKSTCRFYYEYMQNQSIHSTNYGGGDLNDLITEIYHQTLKDYQIFVPDTLASMAQKFGYGGRTQLIIDYVEGNLKDVSISELSNFFSASRDTLLGIPKAEMDRISINATDFFKSHDFSHIRPLD